MTASQPIAKNFKLSLAIAARSIHGFVLYHKRLERGKFKIHNSGPFEISQQQLDWLLAGLDFALMAEFPELDFEHLF